VTPDETVIADAPLDPEQILLTQDLFSSDQTLGPGEGELAVRETSITLGQPTVYVLRPGDMPANRRRPDAHRWGFILIHFRFDLEELPPGRSYTEARFAVEFGDSQTIALELHPDMITTETDVEKSRTFTLGPTLKFAGIDVSPGQVSIERRFEFTRLHPVITSFGAGSNTFYWKFTADKNNELFACSRAAFALLQLPRTTEQVSGTIRFRTLVSRRIAGMFNCLTADGDAQPFTLRPANASFTLS
jgi:hypothetical protein